MHNSIGVGNIVSGEACVKFLSLKYENYKFYWTRLIQNIEELEVLYQTVL